jgi:ribosome hibernation promoting factor
VKTSRRSSAVPAGITGSGRNVAAGRRGQRTNSARTAQGAPMNLHLTGHHVDITPAIRGYVSSKLERISHHFDHVIDVNVILSLQKLERKVEASVHVRGREIFCESANVDMYAAIDGLVDKLDRTIIKHKEKSLEHRHSGAALKRQAGE